MARRRTWWSNAALRSALIEGVGVPTLPEGYAFLIEDDGSYVLDDDGNYIIVEA